MTGTSLRLLAASGLFAGLVLAGCTPAPQDSVNSGTVPAANNAADAAPNAANATNNVSANETSGSTTASTEGGAIEGKGEQAGTLNLRKGEAMTPFTMKTTKGATLTNASLKGKVVLMDFWATWCVPCKMASPTMEKLHRAYEKQGLVVIGANAMENSPAIAKTAPADYAKEHGYTYTFTGQNDKLAVDLAIEGIPCFIFIDRKGNVRDVSQGFDASTTPAQFDAAVKKLLAEPA